MKQESCLSATVSGDLEQEKTDFERKELNTG
ncbi:hypothetical protein SAG0136_10670 [Streptococcus agalactiae LMG 14747]|uniref:Uncharacterized protein n=1 Tax=Streptococcus agalactiae LMG 14747 TaxID=1154860 RepID=V6Z4H5_STRAG|nr:hypothetical protein SAG0136_10670 [Streptococcus agalactiae LMG 14747]